MNNGIKVNTGFSAWVLALAVVCPGLSVAAAETGATQGLVQQLQQLGWQSQETQDGLFVTPPTPHQADQTNDSAAERQAEPEQEPQTPPGLKEQLEGMGWQVEQESDGSYLFHPPAAQVAAAAEPAVETVAEPAAEPASASEEGEGEQKQPASREVQQMLKQRGWRIEADVDGGTRLYPPLPAEEPVAAEPPVVAEKAGGDEQESAAGQLQSQLAQQGWQVQKDSEGMLTLLPPAKTVSATAESEPPAQAAAPAPETLDSRLRTQLESLGWTVSKDAKGSLLITPPSGAQAAEEETPVGTSTSGSETGLESSPPAGQAGEEADRSLPDFGPRWKIHREADGSLILEPVEPPSAPVVDTAAAAQENSAGCGWAINDKAVSAEVELPVNSWTEAHAIARAWLQESGRDDLKVGKIRQVLRIYLVSIVGSSEPFTLKHQLAIRAKDGLLVPIY